MKQVEFRGEAIDLGRFGMIKRGDVLALTEEEWRGVMEDSRFALRTKAPTPEETAAAKKVKPYGTQKFDLRCIPWEKPTLFKLLMARFSTNKLKILADAMRLVGAVVPTPTEERRVFYADVIVEAAIWMGWDKIAPTERLALPTLEAVEEERQSASIEKPVVLGGGATKKVARTRVKAEDQD